jgi:hypothetical protein
MKSSFKAECKSYRNGGPKHLLRLTKNAAMARRLSQAEQSRMNKDEIIAPNPRPVNVQ